MSGADDSGERVDCLAAFAAHRDRLRALAKTGDRDGDEPATVDAAALTLEVRRLDEIFASVAQGLHRKGEG